MSTRKKQTSSVKKSVKKNPKKSSIIINTNVPLQDNFKFYITGISAHNIINLHFDDFSTKLSTTAGEFNIIDDIIDNNIIAHEIMVNNDANVIDIINDTIIDNNIVSDIIDYEENNFNVSNLKHDFDRVGKRAIYFLDNKKNQIKLWPNMIDITIKGPLPLYTNIPCRNCHHTYTTHPLGCPIRYNSNCADNTPIKKQIEKFLKENNFPIISNDYFETERMFCTLACIKSYILSCLSKNSSCKYADSLTYLTLMYKKINENSYSLEKETFPLVDEILPIIYSAQPIDMLKTNGGHLSIDEYRASTGILQYDSTVNIKRPLMFSSSILFQESCVC